MLFMMNLIGIQNQEMVVLIALSNGHRWHRLTYPRIHFLRGLSGCVVSQWRESWWSLCVTLRAVMKMLVVLL